MTTFNGWTLTEQPAKQLNINSSDIETPDAQREDGNMTFEDSYMIGTGLMVYHYDDDDDRLSDGFIFPPVTVAPSPSMSRRSSKTTNPLV
jgi:hypothetical protein